MLHNQTFNIIIYHTILFTTIYNIICFGFKKTNREISTAGGEVIYLFFQKFILQFIILFE